jgi:hypothetical protein
LNDSESSSGILAGPCALRFLFGALKGQLSDRISESANSLVEAIREIAGTTPRTTLESVFLEWEERFEHGIDTNGAYAD